MGDVVKIDAKRKAKAPALTFGHASEAYLTAHKAAEALDEVKGMVQLELCAAWPRPALMTSR